jgi:hypothetical protein
MVVILLCNAIMTALKVCEAEINRTLNLALIHIWYQTLNIICMPSKIAEKLLLHLPIIITFTYNVILNTVCAHIF